MDLKMTSRRTFLGLAAGAAAATSLAACGGGKTPTQTGAAGDSGSGTGASAGAASYWILSGQPQQGVREDTVKRFNAANASTTIKTTEFQNDAFKTKIKTAIGASKGPTLIWGWGGGGLREYVKNDQVVDLTSFFSENAALKAKLFPSSFGAATVNGKVYAMPVETVTPIVFYYNKQAFAKIGAQPPKTWDDIMALVPKFNAAKIAPFSLGGQSRWTNMMWLEFLLDRTAGSQVFQNVFDAKANAWSDPAVLDMLTKIQDLVKANGFIKGFSSITADSNADVALLYTGKAAMMVHGAWTYGTMKADGGSFVSGGNLGYMNFPTVTGGKGDPSSTVGNPAQYLSISSKASAADQATAKKFLATTAMDDASVKAWAASGSVPIVKGSNATFAGADKDFLDFIYNTASKAKTFAQSWDQALSPTAAETLLDNIAKLFQLSITPQQWVDNMNKVIGQ